MAKSLVSFLTHGVDISAFSECVLACYRNFTFPLYNCHFIFCIVLFYVVSLFNTHVFVVLILPACKWLAPFADDV